MIFRIVQGVIIRSARSRIEMADSHKASRELIKVVTILSEIVRDLDPCRVRQYEDIAVRLEKARSYLIRAEAFER